MTNLISFSPLFDLKKNSYLLVYLFTTILYVILITPFGVEKFTRFENIIGVPETYTPIKTDLVEREPIKGE